MAEFYRIIKSGGNFPHMFKLKDFMEILPDNVLELAKKLQLDKKDNYCSREDAKYRIYFLLAIVKHPKPEWNIPIAIISDKKSKMFAIGERDIAKTTKQEFIKSLF